jgi:hypothetical protein
METIYYQGIGYNLQQHMSDLARLGSWVFVGVSLCIAKNNQHNLLLSGLKSQELESFSQHLGV